MTGAADSGCAPGSGVAGEALRRCASGDIPPELALRQLLDQSPSDEETEAVLGTAIWDALENREGIRADVSAANRALGDGLWKQGGTFRSYQSLSPNTAWLRPKP